MVTSVSALSTKPKKKPKKGLVSKIMRRFALLLLVALITFLAGVTAANLLGGRVGHRGHRHRFRRAYVERHGDTARTSGCPYSRGLSELPAPAELPDAPEAPPAPAGVKSSKDIRVAVTMPDGTVKVVKPQAEHLKEF